jgi:hypothetical protein
MMELRGAGRCPLIHLDEVDQIEYKISVSVGSDRNYSKSFGLRDCLPAEASAGEGPC